MWDGLFHARRTPQGRTGPYARLGESRAFFFTGANGLVRSYRLKGRGVRAAADLGTKMKAYCAANPKANAMEAAEKAMGG
ncbi:unknown protein [Azorhizobium caulinodans ORS 571]|uniref:Uncharacterized protein n=1 Tax=Azorhizobium caulinodans (strain ATCC 43989 / DSM 5975 / JCM 20966 / LMG 6465 / NBRC 14845 / NCIMB 13405 / ORS 571) TaxID=438753 RepID=A8I808_AZOC5|nr:unknown protein [Azorhizobium caulinodans ORS 571]